MDIDTLSKSERTKRYIIEKTAPIFNKKGYAGTSLSDLTEATGLTKGSIYGNFRNKDEVALCAFRRNVDLIIGSIRREMAAAETYFDKLMVYPRIYRKMRRDIISEGGCPIINTLIESDDTHEDLRATAVQILTMWKETIAVLVKKGKKYGELKEGADPDTIAEIMISLIEGSVALTKSTGKESYILTALDHLEGLLLSIRYLPVKLEHESLKKSKL